MHFLEAANDNRPKPPERPFVKAIIHCRPLGGARDEPGVPQDFQVLGRRGLGNREVFHNIRGDTSRVGLKKLHDLEAYAVPEGLEHRNKTVLVRAGDIEAADRIRKGSWSRHGATTQIYVMSLG
jgi:hypothetical protein